ncbi:MAG TPA: hypothetical protein VGE50_01875 [Gammaproteobacteria bacterium]
MNSVNGRWRALLFGALLLQASGAQAANLDIGLGLSFVDDIHSDALAGAWDLQVGYEFEHVPGWAIGGQLQVTQAMNPQSQPSSEKDMVYSSAGLYLTASPNKSWLYFKGGIVDSRYETIAHDQHTAGVGMGAGIVLDYPQVRLHVLDFQRLMIGSESFNMYTISLTVLSSAYY